MKILAFETSCDDTAVAIVEDGCRVLSSVRLSQVEHAAWGGVVPEIAARLHAENWRGALNQCLAAANLTIDDIDALAVTRGPGLQTSLLSGTTAASFLSQLYQKPLIPVHHIYGHLCSVFLEREIPPSPPLSREEKLFFPALVLTASGGHTDLYLWESATKWQKIGGTLDDAAGEAFDKTAKMLGLGYPGGPIVSERAKTGDPKAFDLPIPNLGKASLDFSFSGIKAAVYRLVQDQTLTDQFTNDLCASFQATVGRVFVKKIMTALTQHPGIKTFCFVGGVSANTYIKKVFSQFLAQHGITLLTPEKNAYSTDNAAMIASAAYFSGKKGAIQHIEANPRLVF